jgi:REP element-mobilizing transposase RayT
MNLFKTEKPNNFHYVTSVTFNRVPIFQKDKTCEILVNVLKECRAKFPYKLVGYVIMPDHFHIIINPIDSKISVWLHKVRGLTAKRIVDWLKENNYLNSLNKIKLKHKQKKNHQYAVWQKDPSVIDLESHKFLRQKLRYIHNNPVNAKFCEHPKDWKWSSYCAYLPKYKGEIPIEIDTQPYWFDEEFEKVERNKNVVV